MDIVIEKRGGVPVLICRGRLDGFGAGKLEEAAGSAIHDDDRSLVVDMKEVPYLSSAGIRILLSIQKKLKERGGRVVLSGVGEFPLKVLDMAGFLTIFSTVPTVEEAVKVAAGPMERDLLLVDLQAPFIKREGALFSFEPGTPRPAVLRVQGNLDDVLYSRLDKDNIRVLPFSGMDYALGLGALGMDPGDALPLLGEMVVLHGSLVWLPTDGKDTPDFFTPVKDTGELKIFSGYCVSLDGLFNRYVVMESETAAGTPLSQLYRALLSFEKEQGKEYSGVIAVVTWAILEGLESAGIERSPVVENAPERGASIMDSEDYDLWFEHGETPRFAGDTMVSFGFAIDLSDARKTFDQEALGALCYRHAEEAESPGLFSHTHGVVFRDVPYDPGANLDRQIKKILAEGRFVDMRHLMGSTRVRRAKIGVAHIREIRNE